MGRRRMYRDIELPREVVMCVKALLAEEEREKRLGISTDLGARVAIAMGIADKNLERVVALILVDDIAKGRGYDSSKLSLEMDLGTYYRRKKRYIFDVAVALGLATIT